MFPGPRAQLQWLQAKTGERANVHQFNAWVAAHLLPRLHKFAAVLGRELLAGSRPDVRAGRDLPADVVIRQRVLVRDRPRADNAYPHSSLSDTPQMLTSIPSSS